MPQQIAQSVENNFTKGLITESTGLNFPENAATSADNCEFTIIGVTKRRQGFDFETNFGTSSFLRDRAISTYVWKNVGGDGNTQLMASQIGDDLHFYTITNSTIASPLSQQIFSTHVGVDAFTSQGGTFDETKECQYADGNGYLLVFHPSCDPFYVSYVNGVLSAAKINISIRDFTGVVDGLPLGGRPSGLSDDHLYNLINQGWSQGSPWTTDSTTTNTVVHNGSLTFTVNSGMTVSLGDIAQIYATGQAGFGKIPPTNDPAMTGSVTAYSGTTMTINVFGDFQALEGKTFSSWTINTVNKGYINTWKTAIGNYPSNSDVWWYFKDSANTFNPAVTVNQITLNVGSAPKGHFLLSAFRQNRALSSGISTVTPVITTKRPRTGCWFQGRSWFTGVDDSQAATGDANYYTWTENIYFSQVVLTPADLGNCYQVNDPTSEDLFDLLPTDGGVINIQGAGSIYKLFPIQNGLLVSAANGWWFITGSQGIGFAANDYTVTKISSVPALSSTSYVDVLGLPYFWNEDGIYCVAQQQGGGLAVEPITVGTIETLYDNIPLSSKKLARGSYHPIDYTIQWIYKDTEATTLDDSYNFNRILNYNVYNKAFFTYTVDITSAAINSIQYVVGPGGSNVPPSAFKYWCSSQDFGSNYKFTFADEHDPNLVDWASTTKPIDVNSFFITGYKIRGQAIRKFQPQYVMVWRKINDAATGYKFQGIWDYANDPNSGRYSTEETVFQNTSRYDNVHRRHKIRGHGYTLQFRISSIPGVPFEIIGWSVIDTVNQGA